MEQKEGGATAPNSGPAVNPCPGIDGVILTPEAAKTQERGPAPLHLLVDRCYCSRPQGKCGCVPSVVLFRRGSSTFVGIKNPVWGQGAKVREFLGGGKAAERYKGKLLDELRALAWAAYDKPERRQARERRALMTGRGGVA